MWVNKTKAKILLTITPSNFHVNSLTNLFFAFSELSFQVMHKLPVHEVLNVTSRGILLILSLWSYFAWKLQASTVSSFYCHISPRDCKTLVSKGKNKPSQKGSSFAKDDYSRDKNELLYASCINWKLTGINEKQNTNSNF